MFDQLVTSGGDGVVNGPCQCTHLHCPRANADIAAPPEDWLPIFTSLSMWELYAPWHVATDVPSGLGAAQLTRTASRGLARSLTAPSATMARPTKFVSWNVRERVKDFAQTFIHYSTCIFS